MAPLGWNLLLSFEHWSPLHAARWAGAEHYTDMLDDDVFWQALRNTLIFMAAAPIAIAAALGIALLVNSDLKGAAIYRTIVFLSYPLMTVAVGIIWRWMYDARGGLINYVLRSLGRDPPADRVPGIRCLGAALRHPGGFLAGARVST